MIFHATFWLHDSNSWISNSLNPSQTTPRRYDASCWACYAAGPKTWKLCVHYHRALALEGGKHEKDRCFQQNVQSFFFFRMCEISRIFLRCESPAQHPLWLQESISKWRECINPIARIFVNTSSTSKRTTMCCDFTPSLQKNVGLPSLLLRKSKNLQYSMVAQIRSAEVQKYV